MTLLVASSSRTPDALLALCDRLAAAGIHVVEIHAAENDQVALFVSPGETSVSAT